MSKRPVAQKPKVKPTNAHLPLPLKPIPVNSLHYRPRDYFGRYDLQTELLTKVTGRARREIIKESLENGELYSLPSFITDPELDSLERQNIGRIHPMYMGGEYLPKRKPREIEIARISIQSTTCDVTVLYARLVGQRIHYRVVDEYEGETLHALNVRTSIKPLTMGAMIDFFITAWNLLDCLIDNFEDDLEEMHCFFDGESEFYPCFDAELRQRLNNHFQK